MKNEPGGSPAATLLYQLFIDAVETMDLLYGVVPKDVIKAAGMISKDYENKIDDNSAESQSDGLGR